MMFANHILMKNGADGIVFGFLNPDGTLRVDWTKQMVELIHSYGKEAVFHRAIDCAEDIDGGIEQLIELKVDRVLTSGGMNTAWEGREVIARLQKNYGDKIEILPGAGITASNAAWCREQMGVDQMHAAIHRTAYDVSCQHNTAIYFGGCIYPPEDRYKIADSAAIAEFYQEANK